MSKNPDMVPFGKMNFLIILAGFALILIGFGLMSTEDFIDSKQFSYSLYVSPILIVLGHAVIIWGILKKNPDLNAAGNERTSAED